MNKANTKFYGFAPLDAEQVQVTRAALEFYARMLIGQFDEVLDLARYGVLTNSEGKPATNDQLERAKVLLDEAKRQLTGFPPNASKSIGGQHTPVDAQRAYLLCKVLRHRLALERKPDGNGLDGVDFDDPYMLNYTRDAHRVELTKYQPNRAKAKA
jgi:hypothetical protein